MPDGSTVKPLPNPLLGQVEGTERQIGGKDLAGGGSRRPFWVLIGAITVPVVVLDQATKIFVKSHMELYESIPIVRNFLDITYTQNPGAAFSMLSEAPAWVREALLMLLASAAIVVLLVLIVRAERASPSSIAFALILGGATFTFFGSLFAGLVMFLVLYLTARGITQVDPQLLRIVLRSTSAHVRYDPGTLACFHVTRSPHR